MNSGRGRGLHSQPQLRTVSDADESMSWGGLGWVTTAGVSGHKAEQLQV